jgi:sorbitol/mannitol transport system permease protein
MALRQSNRSKLFYTILAWAIGILLFFPIFWTLVAALKSESDAYSLPQNMFSTPWTLENFGIVQARSDYFSYIKHTVVIAFGSTLLGLVFAIPAAWSTAFSPTAQSSSKLNGWTWLGIIGAAIAVCFAILKANDWVITSWFLGVALILLFTIPAAAWVWTRRTHDMLLWMLSTKMMPPAGALIPIYLIFNRNGLIFKDWGWIDLRDHTIFDSYWGMVPLMMLLNLPIMIWMLFTYFKEIPAEILEAARMDGASLWSELWRVLTPMALPGIASTCLLNLTTKDAAPLSFFISEYSSPEGQFWAKLSAASIMAIAPILVVGWFSQRQLVRGLTFGAVK